MIIGFNGRISTLLCSNAIFGTSLSRDGLNCMKHGDLLS